MQSHCKCAYKLWYFNSINKAETTNLSRYFHPPKYYINNIKIRCVSETDNELFVKKLI